MQRASQRSAPRAEDALPRLLFRVGLASLAVSAAHVAIWVVTGESLEGPLSVRRPILFFFSAGLLGVTLAWTLPQLRVGSRPVPQRRIRGLALGTLALLPGLSMIGVQYWRGSESHFNATAGIDLVANVLALLAALAYTIVAAELTRLLWRRGGRGDALGWGLRLGWALHLVATVGVGWALGANAGAPGPRQDALFRMHALGAHAIQLLPGLAWVLLVAGQPQGAVLRRLGLAVTGASLWIVAWSWLAWRRVDVFDAPPAVAAALAGALATGAVLGGEALLRLGLRRRGEPGPGSTAVERW